LVAPDCGHARLGQRETPAQTKAVSQKKYRLAVRCAGPGRVDAFSRTRAGLKELVVMSVRKDSPQNTKPMGKWCVIKLGRRAV